MKTLKLFALSLIPLGLVSACAKDEDSTIPEFKLSTPDVINNVDYQVYSAVLNQVYAGEFKPVNTNSIYYLVAQKSASLKSISPSDTRYKDRLIAEVPNVDQTIFNNLLLINDRSYLFDNKFENAPIPFKLLPAEELDYYFKTLGMENGWKSFHAEYGESNGIIEFSRIGFNNAKDQAVLETGRYTASLAAEGAIIYLVKENNTWKVKKIIMTWIS